MKRESGGSHLLADVFGKAISVRAISVGAQLLMLLLGLTAQAGAQSFEVLYNFGGADGHNPSSGVVADSAGNFYGTGSEGGAYGYGSVYELSSTGSEAALYNFTGGKDGGNPVGGLIRDAAGNLYGATEHGGLSGGTCPIAGGCGVVFALSTNGKEKVLYTFTGSSDGAAPLAGLVRDAEGNFYGTASRGGTLGGSCPTTGCGVVFKLDRAGETVLHTFAGYPTDGDSPQAGLVIDSTGNLYGTTVGGGTVGGTVFELDPLGNETILHDFEGFPTDGDGPFASLTRDESGNLYGTTFGGGAAGFGTVFKLDAAGNESVVYSFTGQSDGGWPFAGVVVDAKGNLYGTTAAFGNLADCDGNGCGVVFKLSSAGQESVLHAFDSFDGTAPYGNLLPYKGYLYGTTKDGGGGSDGEVFKILP